MPQQTQLQISPASSTIEVAGELLTDISKRLDPLIKISEQIASLITAKNLEIETALRANLDLFECIKQLSLQVTLRDDRIARLERELAELRAEAAA